MQISTEYLTELRASVEARRASTIAQLQQIAGTAAILDALIERAKQPEPVDQAPPTDAAMAEMVELARERRKGAK